MVLNFYAAVCRIAPLAIKSPAMYYLLKTEPSEYSFSDLQKDKKTVWDGVTNPQAVKFLRGMNKGDQLVIYHTGEEKRTVGTATVLSVGASDPRQSAVMIGVGAPIKRPLLLAELKQKSLFDESPLVKQPRLSVVPLTEAQWKLLVS